MKYSNNKRVDKYRKLRYSNCHLLKKITICSFFLVVIICGICCYRMMFLPRIELKGNRVVEVEYLDKYQEEGYLSSYQGKDITDLVKIKGKVNTSKIGKYTLEYQVDYKGKKKSKKRIVKVVDKEKPKLEFLTSKDTLYICPEEKYLYDDYKATDNYDGDLTQDVVVKYQKNKILYFVKDSSGNETMVSRKLKYEDVEKPKLELADGTLLLLDMGSNYTESLYTVSDNCSKDIKVRVEGEVDTNTPGTYIKKYIATDSYKNEVEVDQEIVVMEPSKPGVIYLTFDDGPREGTTNVILDILKEEGVPATFFITNNGPDELVSRIHDEGHAIGLHTATHEYSYLYSSMDAYFEDLGMVASRVKNITGEECKIIRFPGGSSNTISKKYVEGLMSSLVDEVVRRGYRYYDWNINSMDAEGRGYTSSDIVKSVTNSLSLSRANVVLMHDVKATTRDALRDIIRYGKEHGYRFEKITPYTHMVRQRVNN